MITRRRLLTQSAAILGVTLTAGQIQSVWAAVEGDAPTTDVLSKEQRQALHAVADMMIPDTDTPGAIAAKVPAFIEKLVQDWLRPSGKAQIRSALDILVSHGVTNTTNTAKNALVALDQNAFAADSDLSEKSASAYRQLKRMVLFSYYSSEIGASIELNYDPVPGPYQGDVAYAEIGKNWAMGGVL